MGARGVAGFDRRSPRFRQARQRVGGNRHLNIPALARVRRRGRFAAFETIPGRGEEEMKEVGSDESNPERQAANRELGGLLESSIDRLPDRYRVVFILREV
jgi:DNA-directed RNA polymerase specialized sigma24 family protein